MNPNDFRAPSAGKVIRMPTGYAALRRRMRLRPFRSIARRTFARSNRAMQLGWPPDKALDYHRYERVKELMKEQGISKTQAVELLAADEEASKDIRGIWRALAWVKRERSTRRKLL